MVRKQRSFIQDPQNIGTAEFARYVLVYLVTSKAQIAFIRFDPPAIQADDITPTEANLSIGEV